VSDVHLQGHAPKIEILSRGGSITLNLTGSGFSGAFEVHVSYGQIEIPGLVPSRRRSVCVLCFYLYAGFVLCSAAPCPVMSFTKSEDLVAGILHRLLVAIALIMHLRSGQGSIFQGELGVGKGNIKVFALTGSDVILQLT
jgi:hypothetical protein